MFLSLQVAGRRPVASLHGSVLADLTFALVQVAGAQSGQPPITGCGGDVGFGDGIPSAE